MELVAFLDKAAPDVSVLGGKGASLARLTQAGMKVPPAFVVTTEAFRQAKGQMNNDIRAAVTAAFDELRAEFVAVRSSAVAEDGSSASWAGQMETYLYIQRAKLADAVQECWQSIGSERAKAYAQEHHVPADQLVMAVVVQRMINSDKTGVMFTANPVTGSKDELMIEAVWGIGESLVQGIATPENWLVNRQAEMLEHTPHYQTEKIVQDAGGGTTQVPLEDKEKQGDILTEQELHELVEAGKKIEQLYGTPQDIEWTIAENQLYIMQARPITTL